MVNVLGLTQYELFPPYFYSHDSSAVAAVDGKILSAVSEERMTRNKHHAGFPWMSAKYCLNINNLDYKDVEVVVPWCEKFNIPDTLKQRFINYGRKLLMEDYGKAVKITPFEKVKVKGVDHQLSHAASAYRNSGFNKSIVLSLDGRGAESDCSSSCGGLYLGNNGELERMAIYGGASLGDFYGFVTAALGFQVFDGEGKTMGLAAFGKPHPLALEFLEQYIPRVDGVILGNSKKSLKGYGEVNFNVHRHYYKDLPTAQKIIELVGRENFAASAQQLLEDVVTELVRNCVSKYGELPLSLAGGVCLNVKLNKKLREIVKNVYVFHSPSDAGATIGAVQEVEYRETGKTLVNDSPYLGCEYTGEEIEASLKKAGLSYEVVEPAGTAAELISKGFIVGWFQGRMEFSPRALGNRSVLASPSDIKIKDKLNLKLKQREWFMPFAPSILDEQKHDYLVDAVESPYMTMAFDATEKAKLEIPATIHVDGTLRPHTVAKEQNPLYYKLISNYKRITGIPAVLNTSFNRHGLPIVCSPEDAIQHLRMGCVEKLIMGNYQVEVR